MLKLAANQLYKDVAWARLRERSRSLPTILEDVADLHLNDESNVTSTDGEDEKQSSKTLKKSKKPLSSREAHEQAHWAEVENISYESIFGYLTKTINKRIRAGYLFNCEKNQTIVAGNPWLQGVWAWVGGK